MISRRGFFVTLAAGSALALVRRSADAASLSEITRGAATLALPALTVWKDPSCGCCEKWIEHMKQNGFTVTAHDTADVKAQKTRLGVPPSLASCHTALVGGYVVEGHVPADLVKRMLTEKPRATGLAVPGMVMGSPGMEGGMSEHYAVILFGKDGKTGIYAQR